MAETDCVAAGWTLVEIETGAMYPICVNNDCTWHLAVLSLFFLRTTFHQHAPQNAGKPKCDHAIIICSSLTSHLSIV